MSDRIKNINENLSVHNENLKRRDLDLILEVNRKAVELEAESIEQNEEIIELLNTSKDALIKSNEKISDTLIGYNEKIALALVRHNEKIDLSNEKIAETLVKSNEKIAEALVKYNEKIEIFDKKVDKKIDSIIEQNEKLSRDIFTVKILFATGLLSLIVQVIQIFIKK